MYGFNLIFNFFFFFYIVVKSLATQVAATYAISKQTQKYITSKTAQHDFPIKTEEDLKTLEHNLKTNPEYKLDVVRFD